MPVLVFKGIEGWCDRLQVLAHCLEYCEKFNSALCVDWSDGVWGAGEFDFHDCFDLEGVKVMTKQQVLRLVASGRVDVRPKCWDFTKIAYPMWNIVNADEYVGEFMGFEVLKAEGDVLVTNGKGARYWDLRVICRHLRFKPEVLKGVQERLKDFDPNSIVVHLRGTDRPDAEGTYTEKAVEAVKRTGIPPQQVYVVTDQKELWEAFQKGIPEARLVNPNTNIFKIPPSVHGTHQTHPDTLKKVGVRKWDMMLDLLADWTALLTCATAMGRSESTYFKMPRGIHELGQDTYSQILRGWVPPSKTLKKSNETLLLSHREQEEVQQGAGESVPSA